MSDVGTASSTYKQVVPFDRVHQDALRWMISRFDEADMQYQLVGGAAARVHGATRPIHDLDFYVPAGCLDTVRETVEPYVTYGPVRQHGEVWRLSYLKARYLSVVVEVADASSTSYFARKRGMWKEAQIDFENSTVCSIGDVTAKVMPAAQLVAYKRAIDREVDRIDLKQMRVK
ncbi:hypothetical protein CRI94_05225 [Longibacter salinarum]|uniref:Uncharacterized protein n=1 Tax=Longibacter salinarum TaxID=1850348 RepID=A0A2A8D0D0_9BACT|nr:hypothetical protein [Longibacter salinarum]PEN14429.1 hypothetical protein CRI94_05225 [Longibacter salinarum]